ncbi:MAG TPA: hypothetical protein VH186_10840 [Chloroflexia bacterium]|nr:hypothetical protein [Chloroflexia bacterium]
MKVATGALEQRNNRPEANQAGPGLRVKGWQLDLLALFLFLALTVFMTWPVTPDMGRSLEQWGDALLQTWTIDWDAHALLSNPLHWADANAFYPYTNTLAFTETLIGQAILVAPVIWLTGNPVLAYNLLLLGSFVLCGWGTYLLVKDLTGSRVAGIVSGLIFAFFPHRFGQLSHLHLLAAQWMPFSLLFLRRFLRGRSADERPLPAGRWRDALFFGLFLALELLSSTYLGLFLVTAVGLYLLYHLALALPGMWQRRSQFSFKPLSQLRGLNKPLRLAAVLLLVGLLVLPFYWPYLAVQQDLGFQRSASEVQSFSAQPFYYLDVPKENKLNQLFYNKTFRQGWWQGSAGGERGLYLGIVALGLGLPGIWLAWKRRKKDSDGLFYLLLFLVAVSFTFGPAWQTGRFSAIPLPYALLYNYVPGFAAIRVPVRFIYVVALALAALAGYGVLWLQQRFHWQKFRSGALLGLALAVMLCGEYWSDVNLQQSDTLRGNPPPAAQWLDAHPAPALFVPLSGSDNSNLFLQYWTRGSWRPIMNGFSGFMPPAYDALKLAVSREGFSPRIVQLLQGLEVRYVVVDSADDAVKAQWTRYRSDLQKAEATVAAQFGSTYIFELKADPWLAKLKSLGLTPDSLLYYVEYKRSDPLLLELTASYLEGSGLIKRENLYGSISIGFRALPPLPQGRPADFLALEAGEDPTLYGFRPEDKVYGNKLITFYRRSPDLLARYDFTRQDTIGALNREQPLAIAADGNSLSFSGNGQSGAANRYITLGLAALAPEKLTLESAGGQSQTLDLASGLSIYRVPLQNALTIKGGKFSLAWAELWQGNLAPEQAGKAVLRSDVVLISTGTRFDDKGQPTGVADIQVVPPGQSGKAQGYTGTVDIYNSPWGAHPQGHFGYWSVPLPGDTRSEVEWSLNLAHKQMQTKLNGQPIPNYPPDPKDLDITRYGNLGDFRANFNLFAGDKLIGSTRLFDFTVWVQGNKNNPDNRRAGAFQGYSTGMAFLVLPPG